MVRLHDIVSETAALYGFKPEDVMLYRRSTLTLIARDHCMYELWRALDKEPAAVAQFFKRVSSQAVTRAVERHIDRVTETANEFY
ncbi:MAG: hypothetical protein U5K75_02950 [Ahrensia sp.]|nr:hypothetical protein [Ahrensia sp.]